MEETKIILKSGKDQSLMRFHPWVFSGAIKKIKGIVNNGDIVNVFNNKDVFLGKGHYQNGTISVRILSFENIEIDSSFWKNTIKNAFLLREEQGFIDNSTTNIYRLVHAEGDYLPGLIIDIYDRVAVMQTHSIGMHKARYQIVEALKSVYGDKLKAVYDKSASLLQKFDVEHKDEYLFKEDIPNPEYLEYGHSFLIDWESGQKTGFFVDQRENRQLLTKYSKGKTVLNTFCYSGGFSIFALNTGAKEVHSLDSSKKAIDLVEKNIALNKDRFKGIHKSIAADATEHIKNLGHEYDVIILDPPAFAKHINAKHQAIQGYKRLNAHAIRQIKSGGIIFTFSCSQVINKKMFYDTIVAASISAGRKIQVLEQLHQPTDHPINIFHPEGEYLKGLVIRVL